MAYEVVVVGGGFGGLTVASLLAARGVNVCLLERETQAGGCSATFEKLGYTFEATASLYAGWQPGEIHERIFAELPVAAPEVRRSAPAYIVRLPDKTDVAIVEDEQEFERNLRAAFPECAEACVNFYRELAPIAAAIERAAARVPDLITASRLRRLRATAPEARLMSRIYAAAEQTTAEHLTKTSPRFRRFIDVQLQIFAQRASDECAYLYACVALMLPRRGLHEIRGGASTLADALVAAIKKSGGAVRLNAPVLRLAYDASGRATGVDLLNGERVEATRAIVSNLTVWDTYGKLVGLNRAPEEIRRRLKSLRGWGAYLLYLALDEAAAKELPANHLLALTDWQEGQTFQPEAAQFMFAAAPLWDTRAPAGSRAVTVSTFTEAEQWFTFHEDEAEHEAQDQQTLERCWRQLHAAMPELGDRIEVIETATPRGYYDTTRRKLGMVGGVGQSLDVFGSKALTHRTPLPNLFLVGDTVFPGQGIAAVSHSALIVANELAPAIKR
jgi:C-3',4' desaturase CrtD